MTKKIQLTQGKTTLVDDEDYEYLITAKWHAVMDKYRGTYRAYGTSGLLLSRVIMKAQNGEIVDHINHDTLDNRKCNLRIVTPAQNMMNRTSKNNGLPKGVEARGDRFSARIYKNRIMYKLGCFSTAKEAGIAYDKKALELFGEYACLNFPELTHGISNVNTA